MALHIFKLTLMFLNIEYLFPFQELQHEVSSLLEFKNALLETFPHLQGKLGQQGQLSPRSGVGGGGGGGSGRASTSTLRGGDGGSDGHASTVESPRGPGGAGATGASVAGGGVVRNGPVRTDQVIYSRCYGFI